MGLSQGKRGSAEAAFIVLISKPKHLGTESNKFLLVLTAFMTYRDLKDNSEIMIPVLSTECFDVLFGDNSDKLIF